MQSAYWSVRAAPQPRTRPVIFCEGYARPLASAESAGEPGAGARCGTPAAGWKIATACSLPPRHRQGRRRTVQVCARRNNPRTARGCEDHARRSGEAGGVGVSGDRPAAPRTHALRPGRRRWHRRATGPTTLSGRRSPRSVRRRPARRGARRFAPVLARSWSKRCRTHSDHPRDRHRGDEFRPTAAVQSPEHPTKGQAMGKVVASEFITLDGVIDDPGGQRRRPRRLGVPVRSR